MKIDAYVVDEVDAPFLREELFLDKPGPGEVLVRMVATGVCHTDLNQRAGNMPLPLPGVLGHEGSGIVEEIGEGVTSVDVGAHVLMGWPYCGSCRNCIRGEHRYCLHTAAEGFSGVRRHGPHAGESAYRRADGSAVSGHFFGQSSFASHCITRASAVVEVDPALSLDLAGPLACGITTGAGAVFNTARPRPGDSVVIFGTGAVGLGAVMAARNTPATRIIAIDLHDSRLELAADLGATHVINSATTDVLAEITRICGGLADHVIDCTGNIGVVETAAEAVAMLGQLILVGGAPLDARFSLDHLGTLWGRRIVGVLGGSTTSDELIPALIALHLQGRFPFDRLVRFYDFADLNRAIEDSVSGKTIKAILRISPAPVPTTNSTQHQLVSAEQE